MKIDYTSLSFIDLINKIEATRFFDLPKMVREAFLRISGRVDAIDVATLPKYKVYTALLTQSGTNAPVATVLENTLGGDVTWTRTDLGYYLANTSGLLTLNKTGFFVQPIDSSVAAFLYSNLLDINKIELLTRNAALEGLDGALLKTLIEIRVYN
jgi:hypothetical protein